MVEKADELIKLGLDTAGNRLKKKTIGKKKLREAVAGYKMCTAEDIDDFNRELKNSGRELAIVPLKDYEQIPPDSVLSSLLDAINSEIFDTFHVAFIRKVKDPILFGKIKQLPNMYFFIDQWGDDVTIEDIIGTEG